MNFPVLNLTAAASIHSAENNFAKYPQKLTDNCLKRLVHQLTASQIPSQATPHPQNALKSPLSNLNPEAAIFLKNLSNRERLQSEFAKISNVKDIDPREFYVRRMLINPYLSAEYEQLINEWIFDSLPINDDWPNHFDAKQEKIDRALALLDFENAFAFLTAGYLLAHFSFFTNSENLDVIAFFESRLQSLIHANPEKYQELNLNQLSLKHSTALKFNKTSLPFKFISELKEQRNHRLKIEKISFWSKSLALSTFSAVTLVASGFWLGKKFTVLPINENNINNVQTNFFSTSVIIASISCLINVYLTTAIYLTEKHGDDLLRFENPKETDSKELLRSSSSSSAQMFHTPVRETHTTNNKRKSSISPPSSNTPQITISTAPNDDDRAESSSPPKENSLLKTPNPTENIEVKTPNTQLVARFLTPIKRVTNYMSLLNKSSPSPRTLIRLFTHKSPTQREKKIMAYLKDIYFFLKENKSEKSQDLQMRYKELFSLPNEKKPRRLVLD